MRLLNGPAATSPGTSRPRRLHLAAADRRARRAAAHIISLASTTTAPSTKRPSCATVPGGFPVTGMLDLGIDTGTLDVTLDVNVAVDDVDHHRHRPRAAAREPRPRRLDLDSIGFGVEDATIGPLTVHRLAFTYEPPGRGDPAHAGGLWDVEMDIAFESPPFRVAGRMRFVDGRFNYAGADVRFTPGIPIYAGVFLNRFAGGFGIDPIRFSGGLGASFASLLQINANWAYVAFPNGIKAMRADGEAPLLRAASSPTSTWSSGATATSASAAGSATPIRRREPVVHAVRADRLLGRGPARRPARALPGRRRSHGRHRRLPSPRCTATSTTTGRPAASSA